MEKHDFRLFKESNVHASSKTEFKTDTDYIGIIAIHPNSILPKNILLLKKKITTLFPKNEFMWNMLSDL